MSQILDLVESLDERIRAVVRELPKVEASAVGLDKRSAYAIWIDEDALIVTKDNDRTLQYYGGFEYVDKDARTEYGDYVIYSNSASRVSDCLEQYFESKETADE